MALWQNTDKEVKLRNNLFFFCLFTKDILIPDKNISMKIHHPPINTPSLGYFCPVTGNILYRETVMDMLKMAATDSHAKKSTFFKEYICSQHSAMETTNVNITAKDLRLKCIILIQWGMI